MSYTAMVGLSEESIAELFCSVLGLEAVSIEIKHYPEEVNIVAYVDPVDFSQAVDGSDRIESAIATLISLPVFVVIRKSTIEKTAVPQEPVSGVHDPRASDLVRLITARSRVSSAETGLVYLPDARVSLSAVTAARHHLIFGRRGAGKTALLVEARKSVVAEGAVASWTNVQTLRKESAQRVVLYVLQDLLGELLSSRRAVSEKSRTYFELSELYEVVRQMLLQDETTMTEAERLVPRVQRVLARYVEVEGARVYVILDDYYYLARQDQPHVLDLLHGCVRESDIWLKIASIRHLTNWWSASPPTGLQTGQDADLLDLDVTLQNPERAGVFLENVLMEYARRVGIGSISKLFKKTALERLVLASGAVPRDYMVLAANAIVRAQKRENARSTGVQDVNQAAGDAAGTKIQELEEDMAADNGAAARTIAALKAVRSFCLEREGFSYFLVSYRDKENRADAYAVLTDLLDVRLLHLIDSGVSDPHVAGHRFEAFMLDLSQFSGSRLKQRLHVLDFVDGKFVSRQTRESESARVGGTPLELIAILRRAPQYELQNLASEVELALASADTGQES